jgi:hypothetical protein
MAEQENGTALVPIAGKTVLEVRDFNAAGGKDIYQIAVPDDEKWGSIMVRAAFLKKGTMAEASFGQIVCAVMYADSMGLNAVAGDVYIVSNRLATTADAKIRHALSSGIIAGYQVEITPGPNMRKKYTIKGNENTWEGPNLHAKITVQVKGWEKPVIYESDLSEWFNGANAAWREHTTFMFRKNALSKALGEVAPMGVDAEEVPATEAPVGLTDALKALNLGQKSTIKSTVPGTSIPLTPETA